MVVVVDDEEEEEERRAEKTKVGLNHRAAKDAEARSPLLLSFTANTHLCSSFMKWTSLLTSPLGAADKRASTFITKSLALEVGNNNGVLMHSMDGLSQSVSQSERREALLALQTGFILHHTTLSHMFERKYTYILKMLFIILFINTTKHLHGWRMKKIIRW